MPFAPGQQVRSRADSSRIGVVRALGPAHGGIQFYTVFWGGALGSKTVAEQDLVAFVESPSPTACLVNGQILGYQEFQRVITYHRLHRDHPLRNNIFAFNASRTRFFPYQFKPLVKFLDSPGHRLLVCDEVGLGKTIEAGLILIEMRARQDLRTVLVVCPASLRDKWKLELRKRFGEDFRILSAKDFRDFLDEYEEAPDRTSLNGIVSYETLRSASILDRLEDMLPSLDLVIADEAHHMRNFGVRTRRAGVAIAAGAGAVIFLTATPVHLGDENLFSLLNLLDEEDFPDIGLARLRFDQNAPLVLAQRLLARVPPAAAEALDALREAAASPWLHQAPSLQRVIQSLEGLSASGAVAQQARPAQLALQRDLADLNLLSHIFTRTRKRDVQIDVAQRRAVAMEINFTPRERAFYDAVTKLVRVRASEGADLPVVAQWQLNTIQRQASSSIHAMVQYYRRHPTEQGLDVDDEELPDEQLDQGAPAPQLQTARRDLARLVSAWPDDEVDSKYEKVRQILDTLRQERSDFKLVIFAFFRETLRYLQRRLDTDGIGAVLLEGSVPVESRPGLIEQFRSDPRTHVLLSSRVGSEGLDFQFCDTLVNYDLPWNPMEVEQRIGRLDRIGQASEVIRIFNLWTLGSIEERILRRLYDRLGVFERSIGALDAVLGEVIRELEREALRRHLSPEEAQREADRVAFVLTREAEEAERLESDAARFIGADEYFREEVIAIQANRRYVTGEQLRRFVLDFVRVHAPGTRLRYDLAAKRGAMVPDAVLQQFLKAQKVAGELIRFFAAGAEGVPVTFEAQVAFDEPSIEFINVLHPFVTAIVTSYEAAVGTRISAQHVSLKTARLPPGAYVFVVYRLSVQGARAQHTMECVLLDDRLQPACDAETAEAILGEMVELGEEPVGGGLTLEPETAQAAVKRAEAVFVARQQELRRQLEDENDAFVERRIASLTQSCEKNLGRVRARLASAKAGAKQERYQRMLRGQLARMEGQRDAKLQQLNALRAVHVEHQEITAGILEIVCA